jgi:tol-pal system protein YbgF
MSDESRRFAPVLFFVGAFLTLPAHAQLFGGDDAARKQIAEQGKRVDALVQQNEALAARLARIEESLNSLSSSNPALQLVQQIEHLRQEVTQLRGQVEVLGNETQAAAKRQRDMYLDLDTRMKRLEQSPPAAAAATPPAPGASPSQAAAPAASDAESRAYEAAQSQRKIGNYQGAIAGFQAFLAQYPKSPLAHRAQYWIGDSQYNLRDFKNAIVSQQRLIANYTASASVPDALLNIASSQSELGDAAGARKTLDGLVTRYPTSDAAEKAKRRLATLK